MLRTVLIIVIRKFEIIVKFPVIIFQISFPGLYAFFGWMVIYNYIIPISLFLCVEIQKFFGSMFVQWDKNLRDDKTDEPAIVRTSDINEELGLITHLFSDKTGTLTKNEMIFR